MTSAAITYNARQIGGMTKRPLAGWTGRPKPKGSAKPRNLVDQVSRMRAAGLFRKSR